MRSVKCLSRKCMELTCEVRCTEVGQAACIVALTVASHGRVELVYAVDNAELQVKEPPHTDVVGAAVLEGALSRMSLPHRGRLDSLRSVCRWRTTT